MSLTIFSVFYSLIVYAFSIVIALSIITIFVSGQSNSEELKIYTYSDGKFLVDYPSNYIVESQGLSLLVT